MDKQGALYFKLLTGVFVLVLAGYALGRVWTREPSYELYSTRICKVGDGLTVSGFVVRSETVLSCEGIPTLHYGEGQWVGGGQAIATTSSGSLVAPEGGYFSPFTDGYEDLLTPEFVFACKTEELEQLVPESPAGIGKLTRGQTWYFAVPGTFPQLEQGALISVCMGDLQCQGRVLRTQEILLLEFYSYGHLVASLRKEEAYLSLSSFEAIPVPKEAIYYIDGESCVYILRGTQAYCRKVHILQMQEEVLWLQPWDLPEGVGVILTDTEITDGMVLK